MAELAKKLNANLPFGRKAKEIFLTVLLIWFLGMAFQFYAVFNVLAESRGYLQMARSLSSINFHSTGREYTLVFGGDVMLARHVQEKQMEKGSFTCAFSGIADYFSRADLAVVNLESPLTDKGPYPRTGFIFKARPENIAGLQVAGIDTVFLANNHFGNAGLYGMDFTLQFLSGYGIEFVGAGQNKSEAYQGKIVTGGDLQVGLINQSYNVPYYAATDNRPGIAVFDLKRLEQEILALKNKGADIIVASLHGGIEYVRDPNQEQIAFAHTAIDAGADVVIGHHPHWIQTIEKYKGKYIFYSLGNLIFDQNWSRETSEGLVIAVKVRDKKIVGFELKPVIIEDNFRPRFASRQEAEQILAGIDQNDLSIKIK